MYKKYVFSSRYRLPYTRLESFETRIEWPLTSENRALRHLRENTPQGFWNHGVLGEILAQREELRELPSSPLSRQSERIILKNEVGECENLYLAITYFEGLDRPASFLKLYGQALDLLKPKQVFLGLEFVPQVQLPQSAPGIDELVQLLSALKPFELFNIHHLLQMTFSPKEHFLHLQNKIFYYYSPFEVQAKMNGAKLLFAHPEKQLELTPEDKRVLTFVEREELRLNDLELLLEYADALEFGVRP